MVIKTCEDYDVIVVGGGPAGIGAAVAASRCGAKTLLVERHNYLGGELATGLANLTFFDFKGRRVIGGIAEELVQRMVSKNASTGHVKVQSGQIYSTIYYDYEYLKYELMEMVLEAKVNLLFHVFFVDTVMDGLKACGIVVETKSGREVILGKVIIDTTGDADVAAAAGVSYEFGRTADGKAQAMTLMFRLGGVDLERIPLSEFQNQRAPGVTVGIKPGNSQPSLIRVQGSLRSWDDEVKRRNLFPDANHDICITSSRDGECNVNSTRVGNYSALNSRELTLAEIETRRQAYGLAKLLKEKVPGFENSYIQSTSCYIGVRETRRIIGEYVLTVEDVLEGRNFDDGIARSSYCIDIHDPEGKGITFNYIKDGGSCGIPYRCLLPRKIKNLIVAGRCISATHEAQASIRVTAICTATGEAAGVAGAMAVQKKLDVADVPINELKDTLRNNGAIL